MVKKLKWNLVLMSVLYLGLGIFLVMKPGTALNIVCYALGGVVLACAAVQLIRYFAVERGVFQSQLTLISGLVCLGLGAFLIIRSDIVVRILPIVFGLFVIFDSLGRVQSALELRRCGYGSWKGFLLLALLSVAGLAVSLALQNVLSNMASAVILLTTKPFQIGHFIEMGSVSGTVVKIGAICTDILTLNNQLVHVPNSEITGSTVTNYTASDKRRLEYRITASYDAPVENVKAALLRAAEHPLRMQEMQPIARVNGYGESAIEYVLFLWIRPKDYMDVYYDVLENVKREFDAAGIEMTYPHINVHHIS